jgi:hypothetical protein
MKTLITLFVTLSLSLSAIAGDSVAIGTTPSVSPRIAVEGQTCTGVGTAAITSTGLPLSCQSGVWTTGGSGTNGWIFTVGGIPFYGVGSVSSGLFSGNMKCTWDTCGGFGYANCGSNPGCAASNGTVYTHYNFRGYTIGANSMPVSGASKIW